MKVIVLGAGVIGVTTAWYLAKAGYEVTVVERQVDAALETSFANGAQISVCFCEPWASKSAPLKMLQWMTQKDAPLLYRFKLDPHQWLWGMQFLANCNDAAFEKNVKQLVSLGRFSQAALHDIVSETGIQYDRLQKGILHYFSTDSGMAAGEVASKLMQGFGVDRRVLSTQEVVKIEPGLSSFAQKIVGGTYTVSDESGDARVFTQALVAKAQALGARFLFGHEVMSLEVNSGVATGVTVRNRESGQVSRLASDQTVVAMGSYSLNLLNSVGERLMIYPAKGYSATMKLKRPALASQVSLLDDERKIAISRLGNFVRIAGTAELNGFDTSLDSETARIRCSALVKRYEEIFPGVADTTNPNFWTGLRPSTPNNIPYIGASRRVKALWVNSGHGTLGWTHGAGSGKALAQLMIGQQPEFEFGFYGPIREQQDRLKAKATSLKQPSPLNTVQA